MNKQFFISIFLIFNLYIQPEQCIVPQIYFSYGWKGKLIDYLGSLFLKNKFGFKSINNAQKDRFREVLPELISYWNKQAPIFFGEIFSIFEKGFKQKNRTATLFLGATVGYGSKRFLFLGLSIYIENWGLPISKEDVFADLVFHELLHVWVDDNIRNSLLIKKYNKESNCVKEHLYLMAIQKMVYLNLNKIDMLNFINDSYRHFAPDDYKRAWEIVNDIEGHEVVIQDLLENLERAKI